MTVVVVSLVAASVWVMIPRRPVPRGRPRRRWRWGAPIAGVGRIVRQGPDCWVSSSVRLSDRSFGLAGLASLLGVVASPFVLAGPLLVIGIAWERDRRARLGSQQRLEAELIVVIDHVALAVAAGLTVGAALRTVAPRLPSRHANLMEELLHRVASGSSHDDALDWWGRQVGPAADDLVTVLRAAGRDGAPLADGLARSAAAARRAHRRAIEARARRLPVTMLLPLVCCVLPAFVLLTVVPVLVESLGALRVPQ